MFLQMSHFWYDSACYCWLCCFGAQSLLISLSLSLDISVVLNFTATEGHFLLSFLPDHGRCELMVLHLSVCCKPRVDPQASVTANSMSVFFVCSQALSEVIMSFREATWSKQEENGCRVQWRTWKEYVKHVFTNFLRKHFFNKGQSSRDWIPKAMK